MLRYVGSSRGFDSEEDEGGLVKGFLGWRKKVCLVLSIVFYATNSPLRVWGE